MINLNEQKDLNIYKKLLEVLSDYVEHFPGTPTQGLFERCLIEGLKIVPKDEKQEILEGILNSGKSIPIIVQDIINKELI